MNMIEKFNSLIKEETELRAVLAKNRAEQEKLKNAAKEYIADNFADPRDWTLQVFVRFNKVEFMLYKFNEMSDHGVEFKYGPKGLELVSIGAKYGLDVKEVRAMLEQLIKENFDD